MVQAINLKHTPYQIPQHLIIKAEINSKSNIEYINQLFHEKPPFFQLIKIVYCFFMIRLFIYRLFLIFFIFLALKLMQKIWNFASLFKQLTCAFNKFNLSRTLMLLQGNLYKQTPQGWYNSGTHTHEFKDKIKELPVYSRCNLLLKNQKEKAMEGQQEKQNIKEIHCLSLSSPGERECSPKHSNNIYFSSKIRFINKSVNGSQEEEENKEKVEEKRVSISLGGSQTPTIKKSNEDEVDLNIESSQSLETARRDTQNFKIREEQLLKLLEKERKAREDLEKDYNGLLKEALRRKFNIVQDQQYSSSQQNRELNLQSFINQGTQIQEKNIYELPSFSEVFDKDAKGLTPITKKTSFIDDVGTQRMRTRPRHMEQSDSDQASQYQNYDEAPTRRSRFSKRNSTKNFQQQRMFEMKVRDHLESMTEKIDQLEKQLQMRENRFKQEILERNLEERERQIKRLMQQRSVLIEENRVRSEVVVPIQGGSQESRTYITFFILFMLGLLVSKTFFC